MEIPKKKYIYGAYVIGTAIFFLYYLFPSDTVKKFVANHLSQGNPNISVTIERLKPALPPGIKLHDVTIFHSDINFLGIEKLKIMLRLLTLFGSRTSYSFKGHGYEGNFSGQTEFGDVKSGREVNIKAKITGVQVQRIAALQRLFTHKISGELAGNFAYSNSGPKHVLTGQLKLSDCRIDFSSPVFSLESLTFRDIDAELEVNNRDMIIKQCNLKGNQLNANISGTIAINGGIGENTLNLNVSMKPHHVLLAQIGKSIPADFLRGKQPGRDSFSFEISGTLQEPGFSFH
jgi:type II secretion system protein N